MIKHITDKFVITEYYNLPFRKIFRYNSRWCFKIDVAKYRECSNVIYSTFSIAPSTLVITHINQLPSHLVRTQGFFAC